MQQTETYEQFASMPRCFKMAKEYPRRRYDQYLALTYPSRAQAVATTKHFKEKIAYELELREKYVERCMASLDESF